MNQTRMQGPQTVSAALLLKPSGNGSAMPDSEVSGVRVESDRSLDLRLRTDGAQDRSPFASASFSSSCRKIEIRPAVD